MSFLCRNLITAYFLAIGMDVASHLLFLYKQHKRSREVSSAYYNLSTLQLITLLADLVSFPPLFLPSESISTLQKK